MEAKQDGFSGDAIQKPRTGGKEFELSLYFGFNVNLLTHINSSFMNGYSWTER